MTDEESKAKETEESPAEDEFPDRTPMNTQRWRSLSKQHKGLLLILIDALLAEPERFEIYNGQVIITIHQKEAITVSPQTELRRGYELSRRPMPPPRRVIFRNPKED